MRKTTTVLALATLMLGVAIGAFADVPTSMNVQGRLTDDTGKPIAPGLKQFMFKIFHAETGGKEVWPGNETGGSDAGGRALHYIEWRWVPDAGQETYVTDMAYLLRDESGAVEVIHDRHVMGLFPRGVWLDLIAAAGFEPRAISFEHSANTDAGHDVFLGLRPSWQTPRCSERTSHSKPIDGP